MWFLRLQIFLDIQTQKDVTYIFVFQLSRFKILYKSEDLLYKKALSEKKIHSFIYYNY